jgi:hypothetical protein
MEPVLGGGAACPGGGSPEVFSCRACPGVPILGGPVLGVCPRQACAGGTVLQAACPGNLSGEACPRATCPTCFLMEGDRTQGRESSIKLG